MRRQMWLLTALLVLGCTSSMFAQGGGGGLGGGGGGSSGLGGGGTTGVGGGSSLGGGGGGLGGGGGGLGGGSGGLGGGGGGLGGNTTGGGNTGRASTGGVSATNFLSGYYSNPMYFGRPGSTAAMTKGGGFGQASLGTATTGGTAGRTTGGGIGGTATARGGMTNQSGTTNQQSTTRLSHTAEMRFPVKAISMPVLQADLQGMIARSSQLQSPGGVRVELAGAVIVLKGRVADAEEKRLVEGMVRLSPGVRDVKNELEHP